MAKKSNFLKNLLTTASAMAVITSAASSAYAAAGDGFSVLGADPAAVGGGANAFIEDAANNVRDFSNTYNIINFVNGGGGGGGGDINVGNAKTIGSYNVYGNDGNTITVNGAALSLGVVYNDVSAASKVEADAVNGAGAAQGATVGARVNLTVQTAHVVTLTGVAAAANGGAAPVGAVANRYDSLGVIDFTGNGGTLLNNAANTIDAGTTVTGADTAGILNVVQNLTVKNASFATFVDNQIRAGRTLAFDVGTNSIATAATSTYTFADNAGIISFKVDATNGKNIDLQNNFVDTTGGNDLGIVVFENSAVAGAPNALTVTSSAGAKRIW